MFLTNNIQPWERNMLLFNNPPALSHTQVSIGLSINYAEQIHKKANILFMIAFWT